MDMFNYAVLRETVKKSREQGVSIKRRLALYWFCMVLAVMAAALLILSATGVLSNTARQFHETLETQQYNTVAGLNAEMEQLMVRGIALSERLGAELSEFLADRAISFEQLNDSPQLIAAAEEALYSTLNGTLNASNCSGAYFCLDATANTSLPTAAQSRAALYIRYSGLQTAGTASRQTVMFRGAAEASRSTGLQLHNRWNPEMDISLIPGYERIMASSSGARLADRCLWSQRVALTGTWESVMLLCVPILDDSGKTLGMCGLEVSALYFSLTHPTTPGRYGHMVTVLAPASSDLLDMERAMLGDPEGTHLADSGTLGVKSGKFYNSYSDGRTTYLGLHRQLTDATADGVPLTAAILVPEESYSAFETQSRAFWIIGSLLFLALMLAAALVLSHRFAVPISKSLASARQPGTLELEQTGIAEFDELLSILQSRSEQALPEGGLPPNVEELLTTFEQRVCTLTRTERKILQYYIDGYELKQIPELAFISLSTVKTHNTNINRKLCLKSHDELLLYIDLFRRTGRLEQISNI